MNSEDKTSSLDEKNIGRTILKRYELKSIIGSGNFGSVYEAQDKTLDRIVALKLLYKAHIQEKDLVRFQREATALGKIHNEHVIDVFDFGVTDKNEPYLVMEFIRGTTLKELLQNTDFDLPEVIELLIQICKALDATHKAGIVHRDLNPSNLMTISDQDNFLKVKLIDFGIAKDTEVDEYKTLTRAGAPLGTPLYMSPEQAQGKIASIQSDIYSFGCIAYELITKSPPFSGKSSLDIINAHINEEPDPISNFLSESPLTKNLQEIIDKLLAKDPASRYSDIGETILDLEAVQTYLNEKADSQEVSKDKISTSSLVWQLLIPIFLVFIFGCAYFTITRVNEPISPKTAKQGKEVRKKYDYEKTSFLYLGSKSSKDLKKAVEDKIKLKCVIVSAKLSDTDLKNILKLEPTHLGLNKDTIAGNTLKIVSYSKSLEDLRMFKNHVTAKEINHLQRTRNLKKLAMVECQLNDRDLEAICQLKKLQLLDIQSNPKVTTAGVNKLTKLKQLKVLFLAGTEACPQTKQESQKLKSKLNLTFLYTNLTSIPQNLTGLLSIAGEEIGESNGLVGGDLSRFYIRRGTYAKIEPVPMDKILKLSPDKIEQQLPEEGKQIVEDVFGSGLDSYSKEPKSQEGKNK